MAQNRAFVMGHPIAHSRSPMLHGYWLKRCGIEGSYERLDIPPQDIDSFFSSFREAGWIGGNITVPHKTAVIPHLDHIDDAATKMGAVNTIWWEDGVLVGGNTDAIGFLGNIDELAPGWDTGTKRAVILGAGGATRAATYGLLSRGLTVALCNRTVSKAESLASHFGAGVSAHGMNALPELIAECDLLVNTTSLGMIGQPPLDFDLSPLKKDAIVYDVIYVPLETELIKGAKARGHRSVDGLGMLLHQGVVGFNRWFRIKPEVTGELRQILIDDIRAKTPGA
ncbi:shikimate dehydrogenase [Rhizobium johnstonii]|uniref:Shikimate dehydrogenase (NADP(+)) n=1 Tax=Rhizobium leguminosarum bv. viciae TaxID=387 RepID=A0A8G2J543_RHILV|nr:shikimate dehydrogenase [Rhizobium leguminosarum]MBY5319053.1 shikimate dehydrogenase [Rhizobium leguminosarum]MBY5339380.1 shikimate dehydrogenase [Rhizobium leguminosarum]MBY5380719.1 shikimate dehydrogenase [Rhizobium leguminosarum]MCA2430215.1 shikimate dehydrogenase [Rhizobium leguminosarum]NEH43304.1 shikimate dehydrogenase [Rhizobium leguminosarum]